MPNPTPRRGFTLLELLLVLTVLIILAAVVTPSLSGLKGNTNQRAAADEVRGRIADARGLAMEHGSAFRLAVHQDGTKLRLAPDVPEFADLPAVDEASASAQVIETKFEKAAVSVVSDADADSPMTDGGGWVTIATFLPDGTCREASVLVEVAEAEFPVIRIHVRGVTGGARILPPETANGGTP